MMCSSLFFVFKTFLSKVTSFFWGPRVLAMPSQSWEFWCGVFAGEKKPSQKERRIKETSVLYGCEERWVGILGLGCGWGFVVPEVLPSVLLIYQRP